MASPNNSDSSSSSSQPAGRPRRGSVSDFFTRSYTGPISSAAAEATQRRRMSIPSSSPVFSTFAASARRGSVSSISSNSSSPVFEEDSSDASPPKTIGSAFARRMSFGAKAMMDVKGAGGKGLSEKAKELSGVGGKKSLDENGAGERRQSVGQLPLPVEAMPKTPAIFPTKANPPDHMQERMLKGDFSF